MTIIEMWSAGLPPPSPLTRNSTNNMKIEAIQGRYEVIILVSNRLALIGKIDFFKQLNSLSYVGSQPSGNILVTVDSIDVGKGVRKIWLTIIDQIVEKRSLLIKEQIVYIYKLCSYMTVHIGNKAPFFHRFGRHLDADQWCAQREI